jgi:transcriptional regulator with XRE-family HTH domain
MEQITARWLEVAPVTEAATGPIDRHVGARIRMRRLLIGMTRDAIAALVGATVFEIQKHEMGENRIDAKRLFRISRVLAVPASYFFEDMKPQALGVIA